MKYKVSILKGSKAYGHFTKRLNLGEVYKKTRTEFEVKRSYNNEYDFMDIFIPLSSMNFIFEQATSVAFDAYKQHYKELYHNIDENKIFPEMFLLDVEKLYGQVY